MFKCAYTIEKGGRAEKWRSEKKSASVVNRRIGANEYFKKKMQI